MTTCSLLNADGGALQGAFVCAANFTPSFVVASGTFEISQQKFANPGDEL